MRKSIALLLAATMASSLALQPAAAQYNGGYNDRNNDRYDNSDDGRDNGYDDNDRYNDREPAYNAAAQSDYQRQQDQYARDRAQYDRDAQAWQERYGHSYRADSDTYYRDCGQQRAGNTTGGLIIGAIAGAALGSTIARGPSRGAGTAIGAALGGLAGASIGKNLECEDRNYAYRTYYDGFERGRPNARYDWRNRRTGNSGQLMVGDYYRDRDGYRCATYSQTIYVRGRPETARGYACRQRDGNWAIID